jgi:antitoxin component HigA of HigAB toxin-antitoxin module
VDIISSIPSIRNSYENKKAIDYIEGLEQDNLPEPEPETSPITVDNIKKLYNDVSNEPTEASEEKLARDLYELMLDSGLTTEEIILAGKYKVEESIEKQEEYALDLITKLAGEWNSSTEFDSVKKLQKILKLRLQVVMTEI